MNHQEAINAIKSNKPASGYVILCEALDMAIKALETMPEYEKLKERDRAMKPEKVHEDLYCFVCGGCGNWIGYTDDREIHEFCLRCGQRIDWTEQEEA